MKRKRQGMLRSTVAVLTSFALAFSMVPAAFATGSDAGEVKYVSLGDSMTNGYGLAGYDGNTGVEDYGDGSYANQFAADLVAANHAQLAMSAMRAEDLHWLLELDYTDPEAIALTDGEWDEEAWNSKFTTGDYWTWNELCDDYRFATAAYAIQNGGYTAEDDEAGKEITTGEAAIVAEYYQNAVKNADVISLGMGNGNFGVFMFGRLLEAIGFSGEPADAMVYNVERALAECDPAMKEKVLELKDVLYAEIEAYLGQPIEEGSALEALANTVVYTSLSYVLNYAGSIDAILQLNPDAEIILVPLMNTYQDTTEVEGVTIGDLLNVVFTPLNAYIAALPTVMQAAGNATYADATFYYAEADQVECLVDEYGNDFDQGTDSIIRDRFVQSIVVDEEGDPGMIWGMLSGVELVDGITLTDVTLEEVFAYDNMSDAEKAGYAAANTQKAISIAVYLAFEDAVIASKDAPVTVESVLGLGGMDASLFGGVMEDFAANVGANGAQHFDTACGAVSAQTGLPVEQVKAAYGENAGVVAKVDMICMLLAMPDTLSASVQGDESLSGLLALFARCVIGNGLGGHPSQNGHNALFEAVKKAYDEGYTAKDETVKNIKEAAQIAADLVAEYYDEAYAYAYGKAAEAGYIEQAIAGLDGVKSYLADAKEWAETAQMTDEFRAELNAAIDNAEKTLAQVQALVKEADVLDQASLNELMNLLGTLNQNLSDVAALAETAGSDLGNASYEIYVTEVLPVLEQLAQDTYDYLMEKANEAYNDFVVAVKEAAAKYAPEVADAIYNYLLNNPEDVLAFLNEYGDDAAAFMDQYQEEIFSVLGFLAVNYGDDLVEFVLENPEEILGALVEWVDAHGENAWELIKVYADASGLTASIQAEINSLEAQVEALKAQLEAGSGELDADVKAEIEKQIAYIEAQIAELEDLLAELNAAVLAGKAEVEAILAEIEAVYDDLNDAIAELQAMADALNADIQAAIAEIAATAEAIQAEIESLVGDAVAFAKDVEALYQEIVKLVGDVKTGLIKQAEEAFAALDAQIVEAFKAIEDQIDAALEQLGAEAAAALKTALDKAQAEIDAAIDEFFQMLAEGTLDAEAFDAIVEKIYGALDELEAALDGIDSQIAADIKAQIADLREQVAAIEDLVVEYLLDAVEDATHGEYEITEMSRYAAIGDATIAGEGSYADKLAAELSAIAAAEGASFDVAKQYDKLVVTDEADGVASAADILAKIESGDWNEQIANADLVTVSVGAEDLTAGVNGHLLEIVAAYMDVAQGKDYQSIDESDWASVVGEENVAYIDEIVAEINAKLVEEIGDANAAAMATDVVEAYAFAYVGFATNYAEVLNAVQGINSEAQVVVVGLNNVFDGLVFNFGDYELNVGDYAQYVVDAADLQFLAYAMLDQGDNVTFVSAPEADSAAAGAITSLFEAVLSVDFEALAELFVTDPAAFSAIIADLTAKYQAVLAIESWMPSAEGQAYIFDQIMNAMTITVKKAGSEEESATLERIWGEYANITSAKIADKAFEQSDWVVIARDDDFRDAMSSAGLAGALDAPIVLTNRDELSAAAAKQIKDLGAKHAYIIGGEVAMAPALKGELEALGLTVDRIWGNQSYDTSVECAKVIAKLNAEQGVASEGAIVAYGQNFQDALSMSAYAYKYQVPIFLQTFGEWSDERDLTDEAVELINSTFPGTLYVAGGTGAVSDESIADIELASTVRIGGYDGYETSLLIAQHMVENGKLSADAVAVCCGALEANGLDALSGSALIGKQGGVILLATDQPEYGTVHMEAVDGFFRVCADDVETAYILGGHYVLTPGVYNAVADYLNLPHELA